MPSLKGWRTHIVMAACFIVGLLDALKEIDIKSFLLSIGLSEHHAGMVLLAMSTIGFVMRLITTTPAFTKPKS